MTVYSRSVIPGFDLFTHLNLHLFSLILAKSLIYTDTQHPDSYARIQEIEAPKPLPAEVPEPESQVSKLTR